MALPQLERCGSAAASSAQRMMVTGTAISVPRSAGIARPAFAEVAASFVRLHDSCAVSKAPTIGDAAMNPAPALATGAPAAIRMAYANSMMLATTMKKCSGSLVVTAPPAEMRTASASGRMISRAASGRIGRV